MKIITMGAITWWQQSELKDDDIKIEQQQNVKL